MDNDKSVYEFSGQTAVYHGKVRDVYTIGSDKLVVIASDRISAFDVILPKPIPYKGQVLNLLAAYFLRETKEIAENWLLETPHPNVSIGIRCDPFPLEIVVRNCLVGHAWRTYKSGERLLCGVKLPDGLSEYDRIGPIITPATKAATGHDEDISYQEILDRNLATKQDLDDIYEIALRLFEKGQRMANDKDLFLADTKYEFGKKANKILLIDEIHTPDSSRYFDKKSYEEFISGKSKIEPKHLSKEFVREWLMEQGFTGQVGQRIPEMTPEFIKSVSDRYIDLYEKITNQKFTLDSSNISIVTAVENSLQALQSIRL